MNFFFIILRKITFIIFLFLLDRFVKIFFLKFPEEISFSSFLRFSLFQNKSILFNFSPFLYYFFFALILFGLFFFLIKFSKTKISFFLWLIIIGAISNFLDYIFFGSVIDFIDFLFFPIFNLADLYIVLGISGILIFGMKKGC